MQGFEDNKVVDEGIRDGNALSGRKVKNNPHPNNGRSPIIDKFFHPFILRKSETIVKRENENEQKDKLLKSGRLLNGIFVSDAPNTSESITSFIGVS